MDMLYNANPILSVSFIYLYVWKLKNMDLRDHSHLRPAGLLSFDIISIEPVVSLA
jgi:hypothetical protein